MLKIIYKRTLWFIISRFLVLFISCYGLYFSFDYMEISNVGNVAIVLDIFLAAPFFVLLANIIVYAKKIKAFKKEYDANPYLEEYENLEADDVFPSLYFLPKHLLIMDFKLIYDFGLIPYTDNIKVKMERKNDNVSFTGIRIINENKNEKHSIIMKTAAQNLKEILEYKIKKYKNNEAFTEKETETFNSILEGNKKLYKSDIKNSPTRIFFISVGFSLAFLLIGVFYFEILLYPDNFWSLLFIFLWLTVGSLSICLYGVFRIIRSIWYNTKRNISWTRLMIRSYAGAVLFLGFIAFLSYMLLSMEGIAEKFFEMLF